MDVKCKKLWRVLAILRGGSYRELRLGDEMV